MLGNYRCGLRKLTVVGVGLVMALTSRTASSMAPKVAVDKHKNLIQINPHDNVVKSSLIILHGLGDTADGWAGAGHEIASHVPGLRVVLPTATSRPVTMNQGHTMPAWYDIKGLDDRHNEQCDGIGEARNYIVGLMEKEQAAYPDASIILGGFSQGGAMSLYTGLQYEGQPP